MKFKKQNGLVVYSMKSGLDLVTGLMDETSFEQLLSSAESKGKSSECKGMNYKAVSGDRTFYFIQVKD